MLVPLAIDRDGREFRARACELVLGATEVDARSNAALVPRRNQRIDMAVGRYRLLKKDGPCVEAAHLEVGGRKLRLEAKTKCGNIRGACLRFGRRRAHGISYAPKQIEFVGKRRSDGHEIVGGGIASRQRATGGQSGTLGIRSRIDLWKLVSARLPQQTARLLIPSNRREKARIALFNPRLEPVQHRVAENFPPMPGRRDIGAGGLPATSFFIFCRYRYRWSPVLWSRSACSRHQQRATKER